MDGFKNNTKMKCFKEGGSVKYESRKEHKEEMSSDMAQDKKLIKKAFKQHDKAEHDKAPTEIKLKKGGRAKKECGTVKKYKVGGTVENTYGTPMTKKDIKNVDSAKMQKPKMLCGGGSMGKYAAGGEVTNPQALIDKIARQENADDASLLPRTARRIGRGMKRGMQGLSDMVGGTSIPPTNPGINAGAGAPASGAQDAAMSGGMKKGGKIKKCAEGGSLKETNPEENPGLAKLPTNVRNKMGYMKSGGKAKKMQTGGTCS
jgi:hypothetical protein